MSGVKHEVVLIGPDPNFPGGIESVIRSSLEFETSQFQIRNLVSWSPNSFLGITNWIQTLFILCRSLKKNKQMIIHCHIGKGGSWIREGSIARFANLLRYRTVVTLHGSSLENASADFLKFISKVLELKEFSSVVTLTPSTFTKLTPYCSNVILLPNPISTKMEIDNWKGQESRNVLFIGLIDTRKGVDLLLSAWEEISESHGNWSLTLIGPMGNMNLSAESFSKMTNVCWLGECEPIVVSRYLGNCGFMVLPSLREQSPLVIWEAMHMGTPILATNLSGIEYQLGEDYPCLMEPGDTMGLKENLEKVITDKNLRNSMSLKSKLRSHVYLPHKITEQYLKIYRLAFQGGS